MSAQSKERKELSIRNQLGNFPKVFMARPIQRYEISNRSYEDIDDLINSPIDAAIFERQPRLKRILFTLVLK